MIKINGDKKTKEWYHYMFKYGKSPDKFSGMPDSDGLVFVNVIDKSFNEICKFLRHNVEPKFSKLKIREILLRLLTLGTIKINSNGKFTEVSDDCLDINSKMQRYIFNQDLKAVGKDYIIKHYLE